MAATQGRGEPDPDEPSGRKAQWLAQAAGLAVAARVGALATLAEGQPHCALVTPAFGADGGVLLLLSTLSIHTRQLLANPACGLLLTGVAADENPQTTPRLSLSGVAAPVVAETAAAAYLQVHPYAAFYADFTDFGYWRLEVAEAYYIGGFAAASRLDVAALQHAIVAARGASAVDA